MIKPIKQLQSYLKKKNWGAIIVPRSDEYLGEYIAPYAERLKWISGFSGSAGIAIILKKKAAIFTDGRYTFQIRREVNNKDFSIHNINHFDNWIKKNLKNNSTLAIDPWLFSKKKIDRIIKVLNGKKINIYFTQKNPIDLLWHNQPKKPSSKVFFHHNKYAGKDISIKLPEIQNKIKKMGCDYFIITSLDSIAWILNLRGSDIKYTPINLSYLILPNKGKAKLYLKTKKVSKRISLKLSKFVQIFESNKIKKDINNIPKTSIVGIDKERSPYWFINQLKNNNYKIKIFDDPCYLKKAVKNKIEIEGAKKANIRDGISVTKFLYWIKNIINPIKIDEILAKKKLLELRKKNKLFFSPSFDTISAFGANAALPHYRVSIKNNRKFFKNGIYLNDSGGQYFDGTTDITRTVVIGKASIEQKEKFTRVLKGHIALAKCEFKKQTRGSNIDYIARKSLNKINCDYNHGTGHGIGNFLGVHEGPQKIFKSKDKQDAYLLPGMILSNEPGYYKENQFGIRIENLILIKRKNSKLCFETISWAPIDKDLLLLNILNNSEKKWLNTYHQKVYNKLAKYLTNRESNWLKKVTSPI